MGRIQELAMRLRAHRLWGEDPSGVSPVVGTLLMVAMVLVLVAGLYVSIQRLRGPDQAPAQISFTTDETQDRLQINSASKAVWSQIGLSVPSCEQSGAAGVVRVGAAQPYQNEAASGTGASLNLAASGPSCGTGTTVLVSSNPDRIRAGDFLAFCASPTGVTLANVRLNVVDQQANARLLEATFVTLAPC